MSGFSDTYIPGPMLREPVEDPFNVTLLPHQRARRDAIERNYNRMYPRLVLIRRTAKALLLARPGTTRQTWVPASAVAFCRVDGSDVREDRPGLPGPGGVTPRVYPCHRYYVAEWLRAKLVAAGVLEN